MNLLRRGLSALTSSMPLFEAEQVLWIPPSTIWRVSSGQADHPCIDLLPELGESFSKEYIYRKWSGLVSKLHYCCLVIRVAVLQVGQDKSVTRTGKKII